MTAGPWPKRIVAAIALVVSLLMLAVVNRPRVSADRVHAAALTATRETYRSPRYRVTITRDVVYRRAVDADGRPVTLRLDVYEPSSASSHQRPVVIWLHSGGFIAGSKEELADYARDFAQRGYVSVAIDYRQRPHMQWFDLQQRARAARDADNDAIAAVAWVRAHAQQFDVAPQFIFAAGYSAGAITAFDLANPPAGNTHAYVAGAISIAGYGIGAGRPGGSPVIAFDGANDTMVPDALTQNSCNADRTINITCTVVTFASAGHEIGNTEQTTITKTGANFFANIIATT